MKIYYIITEFALLDIDSDSQIPAKFPTCHKPLRSLLQMIDKQIKGD